MTVELIPVIELGYCNQGIPVPEKYPWWDHPNVWDKYKQESYAKAGFIGELKPYLAGSAFYRLTDISEENLTKLTKDHTEDFRNGKYAREQTSPFFGGYVLRIDGQDMYFPQCCGDLSDLDYWERLANGMENTFYEGHPEPIVKIRGNSIIFNFTVEENDEPFVPPPPQLVLQIDRKELKTAVERAKEELNVFSERLKKINTEEKLGIESIDGLLVWENPNQA